MSSPHTGVLTCTVSKQRRARIGRGPDRCLLEDLAFLFVLLQSPAEGRHSRQKGQTNTKEKESHSGTGVQKCSVVSLPQGGSSLLVRYFICRPNLGSEWDHIWH